MNSDKQGMLRRPFKNTLQKRDLSPKLEAMPINYHSDGTGRDSYVVANAGGLVCDYFGTGKADVNFVNSLRQINRSVMPNHYDPADITNYVGYLDPKARRQLQESAKKVQDVTRRLSPSPSATLSPKVRSLKIIILIENLSRGKKS